MSWGLGIVLGLAVMVRWVDGAWLNPSVWQVVLFGMAAVLLWRRKDLVWSWGMWPLMAAVVWGLMQLVVGSTVSRWDTWVAVLMWAGNVAGFWVGMQVRDRVGLLKGLVVFAFVVAVVSVLQWFSEPTKVWWFYETGYPTMGVLGNRDRFAEFAEITMPMAVWLGMVSEKGKWFWLTAAATLFAGVVAGASRAGSALVVVEAVVLGMIYGRRRLGLGMALFGGLVVVCTAVVGVEALVERFGQVDPYGDRKAYVESAVAMVRDRPAMGFGLGNFGNAYEGYARIDMDKWLDHAHNDWAEWAVDGGVPFLVLMVLMAWWVAPKAVRSVWGIGLLGVLAHGFVDFPMQSAWMAIWVFALMGVVAAEGRGERLGLSKAGTGTGGKYSV